MTLTVAPLQDCENFDDIEMVNVDEQTAVHDEQTAVHVDLDGTETIVIRANRILPGSQITGRTVEGYVVGFATCSACALHANWCTCAKGLLAPSIVTTVDTPFDQWVIVRQPKTSV